MSSALTPEQQDWYAQHFGQRFITVQEQPLRPSRRVRRGRGSQRDMQVLAGQQRALQVLANARVRPAPEETK